MLPAHRSRNCPAIRAIPSSLRAAANRSGARPRCARRRGRHLSELSGVATPPAARPAALRLEHSPDAARRAGARTPSGVSDRQGRLRYFRKPWLTVSYCLLNCQVAIGARSRGELTGLADQEKVHGTGPGLKMLSCSKML